MATAVSSPVLSNNGSETTNGGGSGGGATPTPAPATPMSVPGVKSPVPISMPRTEPIKGTRGSNKPKCGTCGNVARSRCPFQCCKSCCSKAQNPCHIHVLKPNATLADRGAAASPAPPEQQPSEVAPAGPSAKVTSLRHHFSTAFQQFNNLNTPVRSRKPLSRKEALVINEWRLAKLKEYKESNIEAENEAFDRYMQNIGLLEEVFDVSSDMPEDDGTQLSNLPTTSGEKTEMVSEMKAKMRSNPVRIDAFRKRIRQTVDQGLRDFQFYESNDSSGNLDDEGEPTPKAVKDWWGGKTPALNELNDKLNRARTKEDLKLCIQMKTKIKGQGKLSSQKKIESTEVSTGRTNNLGAAQKPEISLLKPFRATEIDQDALNGMEFHFSSLEEIEDL